MSAPKVYDVIVLGAGFAGLYAVHRAATSGLSVLSVSRQHPE